MRTTAEKLRSALSLVSRKIIDGDALGASLALVDVERLIDASGALAAPSQPETVITPEIDGLIDALERADGQEEEHNARTNLRIALAEGSPAWHEAILAECMAISCGYQPADPVATLRAMIDWHIANEAGSAPSQPEGAEPTKVQPSCYWIEKAEQFAMPPKDGSRPFYRAWQPLYDTKAMTEIESAAFLRGRTAGLNFAKLSAGAAAPAEVAMTREEAEEFVTDFERTSMFCDMPDGPSGMVEREFASLNAMRTRLVLALMAAPKEKP